MAVPVEPRWVLLAFAASAVACATYGPDLLIAPLENQAGSAGSGGGGEAGAVAQAGSSTGGAGGTEAGSSGNAGSAVAEAGAPPEPAAPYLTAKISEPPPSVALTDPHNLDWAHWGLKDASDYNHKAGITSQLLDFKPVGAKAPQAFTDGTTTFTWSDGTPTASGSSADGIAWAGLKEGFQLVVPAVVEARRLRLYIGIFAGTGRIKAALSDPRATTKVDTPIISAKQAWAEQVLSLEYGGCDEPSTTLSVALSVEGMVAPSAAVSISALTIDNP